MPAVRSMAPNRRLWRAAAGVLRLALALALAAGNLPVGWQHEHADHLHDDTGEGGFVLTGRHHGHPSAGGRSRHVHFGRLAPPHGHDDGGDARAVTLSADDDAGLPFGTDLRALPPASPCRPTQVACVSLPPAPATAYSLLPSGPAPPPPRRAAA